MVYRCVRCLQQVDIEYKALKTKLQDMFNVSGEIESSVVSVCFNESF